MIQELDKQWRICYETIIRAKSLKGYRTSVWKVTENKFQLEVERPELGEDWDQRLLMSTLSWNLAARRLTLVQTAEKDQARVALLEIFSTLLLSSGSGRTAPSSSRWTRRTRTCST